jgi:hypothetical protein
MFPRRWTVTLTLLGVVAGCDGASTNNELPGRIAAPIYNGTLESTQSSGVIALLRDGVFLCSGDIVNQYWVVTAASCISAADDSNSDGAVTFSENAGRYTVTGGPNSTGGLATLTAYKIVRHPNGAFSTGGTTDVAMIFVSPGSTGHSIQYIDPLKYTGGTVNVYQGSASSLVGQNLLTYGFGAIGPSNLDRGNRHYAWKLLSSLYGETGYYGGLLNNGGVPAGISCDGDIGGPDFYWDGAKLNLLGIHALARGVYDCSGRGLGGMGNVPPSDFNAAAAAWSTWLASTAATCPAVTRSGRCHF